MRAPRLIHSSKLGRRFLFLSFFYYFFLIKSRSFIFISDKNMIKANSLGRKKECRELLMKFN